jgi:superfamily I DNA/RNA helicase
MKHIEISLEDIREAEALLLGEGKTFGDKESERIEFISNLKTCDLLAVPGSGKTTALLAKLFCLHKHLPFEDGSGILVLAHTNAAIDEIKEKLQPHCPRLFQYPNFIDTVQSFVNKHLAIPRFIHKYGAKPYRIDSAYYYNELEKLRNTFFVIREVKHLFNTPKIEWLYSYSIGQFEQAPLLRIIDKVGGNEVDISKPKGKAKHYEEWDANTKKKVTETLIKIKKKLWEKGALCYDDSYLFASKHLDDFPELIILLQHRFKYIFIDEMQDLQQHQIDIIDKIFFNKDSSSIIQRIGDKNQAIYSSSKKVKVESVWETREEYGAEKYKDLIISGSNRLTTEVAKIVDCLVLDRKPTSYKVVGNRVLDKPLAPILIVFSKEKRKDLPGLFKTIIKEHQNEEQLPLKDKNGNAPKFNLIAWSGEWGDERTDKNKNKIRLEDIVPYSKEAEGKKEFLDSLSKHLQLYDKEKRTMEAIRKSILNALIQILKIEEKTYLSTFRQKNINRYYTKSKMVETIKERSKEDYDFFKGELYDWCWQTIRGNEKDAYEKIKEFVMKTFKDWFELEVNADTLAFLEDKFNPHKSQDKRIVEKSGADIDITIGTVHSVKGQTHCATMYVETAYQSPTYESNKLIKRKKSLFNKLCQVK